MRGLEVDLRSLALFRIALGLVMVVDLLQRLPQLTAFYTDQGVLPRDAIIRFYGSQWLVSGHHMSGAWSVQLLLFLLAVLFATGFMVGYRTRLCALVSWVLLVSMHARNPFVLHGGDAVLRLLVFWSIFAPLNARLSLDRALNPTEPALPVRHLSPASLALVFQICGIYWFAAAEKMHPVWLIERTAVYYAMSLDQFATPVGRLLLEYPEIMRLMTTGTLMLELFGPILAISPFFTAPLRILVATSFIGFHLGLALTMRLDLFPWVCVAAWLAFLPGALWDRWEAWRASAGDRVSHSIAAGRLAAWPALARLRPPPPRPIGVVGSLGVLFFLFLATASFLGALSSRRGSVTRAFVHMTMLDQSWKMFAPYPSREDGWFVIEGLTEDGRRFDLWYGGSSPTEAKPADFRKAYPNTQWGAYLTGLRSGRKREYRPYFGRYLCRAWNDQHARAERVRLVSINYMVEITPAPGERPTPAVPEVVWQQPCAG